ncbi:MAG TPA: Gfo/Idh/MocA family oxidoreductase [Planctomycetota bacterium]|nr:Gfo/Idh/MocA family oxidoreductase [Planctomycetota bacterium]
MIRLGALGYGTWGRHVVRVADATPGARLVAIAEADAGRRGVAAARHPGAEVYDDAMDVLARNDVDAVLVATDAAGHAALVEAAAAARKHVLVEKPLALSVADARRAVEAAERHGVVLQVGHLLRYHPAVEVMLKVARQELGRIRCVAAQRLNFGQLRTDENVLFSLGPHDLSIMLELFGEMPLSVAAQGSAFVREGIEDLSFLTLRFPGGGIGHLHLSWLDPHKVRRLTVVGERKMAVFDDMEPREKVRVFDSAVEAPNGTWVYGENLSLRTGDIFLPSFPATEPLAVEIAHFVDCVRHNRPPRTGGEEGIRVVKILAAAQESMRSGGAPVRL